ncbi:MAG: hypothetical protein COZ16_11170 [Flavobacteriaceae bacterium CG_4_10_14_3_um_filter_31_253]|nr:MAG: hypothetical protein COW43_06945 [Flavobacteriaceae bacterium CG17_big_fil_post_rev_8_21_14_2_50_31_13]PIX15235.1 MAG: hypothetical protein COZ74_00825 [Flavobacteriaceae bacterium CG_4_8_14_3_um_filter_31_8]PIY14033.1 MAG: hypothetical protein COZ16_11170 [Flavobacteriaceae bacterium CG_4_10_14_3_um_filter_31_253]PIZ09344.1 MAG: hypothetical protein COY55_13225 [Flavobacteriaceae bacterium CG_4_10_14_0_8_um_filter_31_99]PJC10629.1 MAG: hypothetical protein CO067_03565 [Flavobacteriacea
MMHHSIINTISLKTLATVDLAGFFSEKKISNRFVAIKQLLNKNKPEQEYIIHEIEAILKFKNPDVADLQSMMLNIFQNLSFKTKATRYRVFCQFN